MNDYPLLNTFLTIMWVFLWIMWFMILFRVITDIFRDDDLSGWGKAGWMIFACVLPFLGVFVYLIARGRGMGARAAQEQKAQEDAMRSYIRDVAATAPQGAPARPASGTDELVKLAELKNHGDISEEEFQQAKKKLLAV
ncbi:SHOCT domain-containing protein [Streptomyces sp. NPDC050448]|uniref:SHOCT domain-containing protein n=1 Tax=Streptomyces sp. NPDC050448 TaxID=3155404 RepID=UPI0034456257